MNVSLLGMGWATPLGRGLEEVMAAVLAGQTPPTREEPNTAGGSAFPVYRVPPESLTDAASLPRLRRSSAISHFAVAAASDAAAGLTPEQRSRTALIFASTDGGVIYTRRFYGDIVQRGPGAGSPLLFPETVYNAPASHIAARLGLEGEALTLVGDTEVGFDAIQTAAELLACGDADYCLVAAAQELDWITCEAYSRWRISGKPGQGAILAEGGAAVLLGREPGALIVQSVISESSQKSLGELGNAFPSKPDLVVSSNSGTPHGIVEQDELVRQFPQSAIAAPKKMLGEAMASSSIQQVIFAGLSLQNSKIFTAGAFATGFNCGISALFLTHHPRPD
jgi:3-oxoacyl-[acyl-carrier-protein] synthase III